MRKTRVGISERPKKVILKPGVVMTDNNIKKIIEPNSNKDNIMLVKDLVKRMKLESYTTPDDRARNKVLCDIQNVCNIVAQVKEKLAISEQSEL